MNILYAFISDERIQSYNNLFLTEGLSFVYKSVMDINALKQTIHGFKPSLVIFNYDQEVITFDDLITQTERDILPHTGFLLITDKELTSSYLKKYNKNNLVAFINDERFFNAIPTVILFEKYIRSKEAEQRTVHYRDILLGLSKTQLYKEIPLETILEQITLLIAEQIHADCVGIWIIDNDNAVLKCLDFYQRAENIHTKNILYPLDLYEEFINNLGEKKLHYVYNVNNDAILSKLIENRGIPDFVKSEIDSPIFIQGNVKGLITCSSIFEHVEWTNDEQNFLSSAADIAASWIERFYAHLQELKYEKELLVYDSVYKNTNDLVCITDAKFCITAVSNSIEKILGFKESEMIGKNILEFSHVSEINDLQTALLKALNTKTSYGSQFRFLNKNGEFVWLKNFCNFISDSKGGITSIVFICEEITKEIKTKETLNRIKEEYSQLIDVIDAIVWRHEANSPYIRYISKPVEKITGYSIDEWIKIPNFWENHIHTDDRDSTLKVFKEFYRNEAVSHEFEYRMYTRNGKVIWIRDNVKIVRKDGQPVEFIGVMIDITSQKENEAILIESENKFKTLVESSDDAILLKYLRTGESSPGFFLVNGVASKIFQYSKEEFLYIGTAKLAVFNLEGILDKLNELEECRIEDTMIRKDNSTFLAEIIIKKIEIQKRQAALFLIKDVTQKKESEHQLRLFKKIIEITNEAVLVVNSKGRLNYYNKAFSDMFKAYNKVKRDFKYSDIFPADSRKKIIQGVREKVKEGSFWEGEIEAKDYNNNKFPINIEIGLIRDKHNFPLYYFAFITDLTTKKSIDARIKRLSAAVEQSPTSIVITDTKGNVEYVNPRFTEITGYKSEEIIGKNQNILKSEYHSKEWYKELWDTILRGDVWQGEFRNRKKSGELYWVHALISPIKNDAGEITHFLAIKEDITELVRVNESLKLSLKEKETLLKEIHHRVKNNLQVISSLLSLQSDYIKDTRTKELFEESTHRIKTMALIHERLYQSENLAQIDYSEYISELTNYLLRTYRDKARFVQLNLQLDKVYLPVDYAIPCGLIINELVSNSLKYAIVDEKPMNLNVSFKVSGQLCTLIIADDGAGIPEHIDFGNTTSLGLQLVYDLSCQLEGEIKLVRGNGTEFIITFTLSK